METDRLMGKMAHSACDHTHNVNLTDMVMDTETETVRVNRLLDIRFYHRPPMKLREGNVFSRVSWWSLPMMHWTSLYSPPPKTSHPPKTSLIIPTMLVTSGGHRSTYGWQEDGTHPTGISSCYILWTLVWNVIINAKDLEIDFTLKNNLLVLFLYFIEQNAFSCRRCARILLSSGITDKLSSNKNINTN